VTVALLAVTALSRSASFWTLATHELRHHDKAERLPHRRKIISPWPWAQRTRPVLFGSTPRSLALLSAVGIWPLGSLCWGAGLSVAGLQLGWLSARLNIADPAFACTNSARPISGWLLFAGIGRRALRRSGRGSPLFFRGAANPRSPAVRHCGALRCACNNLQNRVTPICAATEKAARAMPCQRRFVAFALAGGQASRDICS